MISNKGGDEMSKTQYRHELKHIISISDYYAIRHRIRAIAVSDKNVAADGCYQIRSLYFDNLYDKALQEKINGVNHREKFRIRLYNGDSSLIKLEKKRKTNGLCQKDATSITKEECEAILKGDYCGLLQSGDELKQELYAKIQYQLLRPTTIVDYRREPYVYQVGNVRITFDMDIRSGLYAKNLFDTNVCSIPIMENNIIMEVKYDAFLPQIICDIIQTGRSKASAFSKYADCRIYG